MELSFYEKLFLSFYDELYNKYYDVNDERMYDIGPGILVRHVEMQNVVFIFQTQGLLNNFAFTLNWCGPYSPGLQALLNELDKKSDEIRNYYQEYDKKKYGSHYNKYEEQLNDSLANLLEKDDINIVAHTCYLLDDIITQNFGIEAMSNLIYVFKTVLPGESFPNIIKYLEKQGQHYDSNLLERIWKYMALLNIRNKDVKQMIQSDSYEFSKKKKYNL